MNNNQKRPLSCIARNREAEQEAAPSVRPGRFRRFASELRRTREGLAQTIAHDEPVVVLELNHWCLNAFQRISVPDFFDFLRGVFPYLYAIEGSDARNIHDRNDAYHVMYHHIVGGFKYPNLVGAFHPEQLRRFAKEYKVRIA